MTMLVRLTARQQHDDGCTFAPLRLEKDRSPVLLNDILDDRQPQTTAGDVLGGHPGVKKPSGHRAGQTRARIAHRDENLSAVLVFARTAAGRLDPQIPPAGHGFNGILEQVQKDLDQGVAIPLYGGQVSRKVVFDVDFGRPEH